jgi:nicotinamidase-related amidase
MSLLKSQRCALLVVDVQHDFVAKGGYYDRREHGATREELEQPSTQRPIVPRTPALARMLERLTRLLDRAQDHLIVPIQARYDAALSVRPPFLTASRKHFPCKEGTWGARMALPIALATQVHTLVVVTKHTYDAFFATDLAAHLLAHNIQNVFVLGVETHICVLRTAQTAALHHFRTTIVTDCTWTAADLLVSRAALDIFRDGYGITMESRDL